VISREAQKCPLQCSNADLHSEPHFIPKKEKKEKKKELKTKQEEKRRKETEPPHSFICALTTI